MNGLWLLAGVLWGIGMVSWQHWSIQRLDAQALSASAFQAILGLVARLGISGVLLVGALRTGFWSGLAVFAGWWLGRWGMLLWLQR